MQRTFRSTIVLRTQDTPRKIAGKTGAAGFLKNILSEWYIGGSLGLIMAGGIGWVFFMGARNLFGHNEHVFTSEGKWTQKTVQDEPALAKLFDSRKSRKRAVERENVLTGDD